MMQLCFITWLFHSKTEWLFLSEAVFFCLVTQSTSGVSCETALNALTPGMEGVSLSCFPTAFLPGMPSSECNLISPSFIHGL